MWNLFFPKSVAVTTQLRGRKESANHSNKLGNFQIDENKFTILSRRLDKERRIAEKEEHIMKKQVL
jgi:hypothetical protein